MMEEKNVFCLNNIFFFFRDGARRSGLFCAICAIFERMKVDREVDVFQTVKQIRVNRPQFIEDVVSKRQKKKIPRLTFLLIIDKF